VRVDPRYFRPAEVETLLGDPTLAKEELGWVPTTTLDQMVDEMVGHDLDRARRIRILRERGFDVSLDQE
jgi:GDPmannose 4,6-dehydratase